MGNVPGARPLAAAWLMAFAGLLACGSEEPAARTLSAAARPPNIVLIVIDSLRADHVGAYGYSRPTTAFIDRLADEGLVFLDARAASSFTRESISALFTGLPPSAAGAAGWRAHPGPDAPTLAERLSEAGYRTGFFADTVVLKDAAFSRGFDTAERPNERWDTSGGSRALTDRALAWIGQDPERPYFVYLHYLDPHGPYEPPQDLDAQFSRERPDPRLHLYRDALKRLPSLMADGFGPGDARFEDLVDRYDAEIADVDRAVARLWNALDRKHGTDNGWWIVTADHGEEFLEHGSFEHAFTLYEESIRVPLVFWAPGRIEAGRVSGAVSLVDVAPTLLGGLGLGDPGRPPLLLEGENAPLRGRGSERPYLGELLIGSRNVLRSRIEGTFKYLEILRWQEPHERRFGDKKARKSGARFDVNGPVIRRELYDLEADPMERRNVLAEHPDVAARMASSLAEFASQHTSEPTRRPVDGAEAPESEESRRLEALGYVDGQR